MDDKKQKQFAHELKTLVAKYMKAEIKGTVDGVWEDGPFSDEYEKKESELLSKYKMQDKGGMNDEHHDLYMESFSESLDLIGTELERCLDEFGQYPHRIYEYGVCIAKFHSNAQTEAHDLWEEVTRSTDDMSSYFETIDPDGDFVTIKIMEDD